MDTMAALKKLPEKIKNFASSMRQLSSTIRKVIIKVSNSLVSGESYST